MGGNKTRRVYLGLLCLTAIAVLLYLGRPTARVLPLEELEAMWIQRMLQGRSEDIAFYAARDTPQITSPARAVLPTAADPRAWELEKAIRILDSRGSYLWGFFGTGLSEGGGWELGGGLLEEVALPEGTVLELFILRVMYQHPALLPLHPFSFKRDYSFRIFLVQRNLSTREAKILQTWEIPPSQVKWEKTRGNVVQPITTASLVYDPARKRATVMITGITQDITAQIDIDGGAR